MERKQSRWPLRLARIWAVVVILGALSRFYVTYDMDAARFPERSVGENLVGGSLAFMFSFFLFWCVPVSFVWSISWLFRRRQS